MSNPYRNFFKFEIVFVQNIYVKYKSNLSKTSTNKEITLNYNFTYGKKNISYIDTTNSCTLFYNVLHNSNRRFYFIGICVSNNMCIT